MAKLMTAQPTLQSLIEQIQLTSDVKISKEDIAIAIGISREHLSRLLAKENKGQEVGDLIIKKVLTHYGKLLKQGISRQVPQDATLSIFAEEIFKLRAICAYLVSVNFASLSKPERKKAEATIAKEEARQLALWKDEGTL